MTKDKWKRDDWKISHYYIEAKTKKEALNEFIKKHGKKNIVQSSLKKSSTKISNDNYSWMVRKTGHLPEHKRYGRI